MFRTNKNRAELGSKLKSLADRLDKIRAMPKGIGEGRVENFLSELAEIWEEANQLGDEGDTLTKEVQALLVGALPFLPEQSQSLLRTFLEREQKTSSGGDPAMLSSPVNRW